VYAAYLTEAMAYDGEEQRVAQQTTTSGVTTTTVYVGSLEEISGSTLTKYLGSAVVLCLRGLRLYERHLAECDDILRLPREPWFACATRLTWPARRAMLKELARLRMMPGVSAPRAGMRGWRYRPRMVKIRLMRMGKKGDPSYRVVIADVRSPRDGRIIENIGWYDPGTEPSTIKIDAEKARHWLSVGAQPTESTRSLLRRAGIIGRKSVAPAPAAPAEPTTTRKRKPAAKK
jgi:small subunit ribosomal protein S16